MVDIKAILANCPALLKEEAVLYQHCLEWGWRAADLDGGSCHLDGGRVSAVDGICPEGLRSLNVMGLSCLTCLFNML